MGIRKLGRPKKYIGEEATPTSFYLTYSALENLKEFADKYNWSRNFALNLILKYLDKPNEWNKLLETIGGVRYGKTKKVF